jgi:hypothetical protein
LCALCGVDAMPTADGEDITPLLQGDAKPVHAMGVTEHPWSKAVLKDDWRLVYYPRGFFQGVGGPDDFGELYNLAEDPWEMRNRYFDPACRDKIMELQRDLLDWTVTTTRVKTVLPSVFPKGQDSNPVFGPDIFLHHRDKDDKLSWRDVAAMKHLNYR